MTTALFTNYVSVFKRLISFFIKRFLSMCIKVPMTAVCGFVNNNICHTMHLFYSEKGMGFVASGRVKKVPDRLKTRRNL